jgi:signal peptidase
MGMRGKSKKSSFVSAVYTGVIFLLLIILGGAVFQRVNGKPVSFFGVSFFIIQSKSMMPAYGVLDLTVTKKTPEKDLKEGDVITFMKDGLTVTHRIVSIENDDEQAIFYTKGDQNPENDPGYVTSSQILGKNEMVIPVIGQLITWAGSPGGLVALAIIFIILLWYQTWEKQKNPNRFLGSVYTA